LQQLTAKCTSADLSSRDSSQETDSASSNFTSLAAGTLSVSAAKINEANNNSN